MGFIDFLAYGYLDGLARDDKRRKQRNADRKPRPRTIPQVRTLTRDERQLRDLLYTKELPFRAGETGDERARRGLDALKAGDIPPERIQELIRIYRLYPDKATVRGERPR